MCISTHQATVKTDDRQLCKSCRRSELSTIQTTTGRRMASITTIEDLSNEIFYEIFEYFQAFELYELFAPLNTRFQQLLHSSSCLLKFTDEPISESQFTHYCSEWIIPNKRRLFSLHLNRQSSIDTCLSLLNINASYHRLQSLILKKIKSTQLLTLLPHLILLSRLFSLTVELDDHSENVYPIYQLVLRLPHLICNHLSFASLRVRKTHASFPSDAECTHSSPIEHLRIDHTISLDSLVVLLSCMPRLRRLTCEPLLQSLVSNRIETLKSLPNLTQISIRTYDLSFDLLEALLAKVSCQVQRFCFMTFTNLAYLDPDRWQDLIERYMPHLTVFDFRWLVTFPEHRAGHMRVSRFTSPFWTARQWILKLKIGPQTVAYYIQPRKQMWFDSVVPYPTTRNSLVTLHVSLEWDQSSMDLLAPLLASVTITYLNIDCDELDLPIFLRLLDQLPELDTLRLSSPLAEQLNEEQSQTVREMAYRNKITNVNLVKIANIEEIAFIIDLCPRLRFLRIDPVNDIDPVPILRFIAAKRNDGHVRNLRQLCFPVVNLDSQTTEMLLTSWTIAHLGGSIHFFWR